MVKLIAIYRKPEDEAAFLQHYREVHTPLVRKMPGLEKLEVTKIEADAMGSPTDYFLLAEMSFADEATLTAAMNSAEGRAAAKDLMSFARPIVTMVTGTVQEG
jgi:uncharacterized protein (TIGR02118 family)